MTTAIDTPVAKIPAPFRHLTAAQVEAFGREMDAIRERVKKDLGQRDVEYIRGIISLQKRSEIAGRALMYFPFVPPLWLGGVAFLSVAKILENMEIGHNIIHGQYDFARDPALDSRTYDWDNVCPGAQWKHSHNYMHHTFTNVVGKDRDVGYGILRMSDDQPWEPKYLGNPVYATLLALLFEWGVALHDLETDRVMKGEKPFRDMLAEAKLVWKKSRKQMLKDYVLFPALSGPFFVSTLAGNALANVVRNLWAFTIIFCGHFPDGTEYFSEDDLKDETRGQWYLRQLLGSANIEGGEVMHIMSGNLSHQIEHHLFPDLPAHRYAEIAVEVRAACARYELPYNTGSLGKQFGSVVKRIVRLALPPVKSRTATPATA